MLRRPTLATQEMTLSEGRRFQSRATARSRGGGDSAPPPTLVCPCPRRVGRAKNTPTLSVRALVLFYRAIPGRKVERKEPSGDRHTDTQRADAGLRAPGLRCQPGTWRFSTRGPHQGLWSTRREPQFGQTFLPREQTSPFALARPVKMPQLPPEEAAPSPTRPHLLGLRLTPPRSTWLAAFSLGGGRGEGCALFLHCLTGPRQRLAAGQAQLLPPPDARPAGEGAPRTRSRCTALGGVFCSPPSSTSTFRLQQLPTRPSQGARVGCQSGYHFPAPTSKAKSLQTYLSSVVGTVSLLELLLVYEISEVISQGRERQTPAGRRRPGARAEATEAAARTRPPAAASDPAADVASGPRGPFSHHEPALPVQGPEPTLGRLSAGRSGRSLEAGTPEARCAGGLSGSFPGKQKEARTCAGSAGRQGIACVPGEDPWAHSGRGGVPQLGRRSGVGPVASKVAGGRCTPTLQGSV